MSHALLLLMFRFFVIDRTRKQTLLTKRISFVFINGRLSVSQTYNVQRAEMKSNILWVTWYALNCKIFAFFSLRSSLKEVLLKCRQINYKVPAMEFLSSTRLKSEGLHLYQKYRRLQVFS